MNNKLFEFKIKNPKNLFPSRLRGDSKNTWLYSIRIDIFTAKYILNRTLKNIKNHKITKKINVELTVTDGTPTRGEYFRYSKCIILYRNGHNVGTLLHEIAHCYQSGHDKKYKQIHKQIINFWEKYFNKKMHSTLSH